MTYDEFTEALRQTRKLGSWGVDSKGRIRLTVAKDGRVSPEAEQIGSFCPLTAVVLSRAGQELREDLIYSARGVLGMSADNGPLGLIVSAADNATWPGARAVRKDLLSATGISSDGCEPRACGCK